MTDELRSLKSKVNEIKNQLDATHLTVDHTAGLVEQIIKMLEERLP